MHTSPYKIIALSMVRNEQDIIEPFVRHNLKFVDFMVIADNNSTDKTSGILKELAKETKRILVFERHEVAYTQAAFMTSLLQAVQSTFFSDFIVCLDADEFIGAKNKSMFVDALSTIPRYGFGRMPWQTYILPKGAEHEGAENPPSSMLWKRKKEYENHFKVVLRLDGALRNNISLSAGNHIASDIEGNMLPSIILEGVPLLHFPVRSVKQLTTKSINGWMAVQAKRKLNGKLERNEAHQWRENFERAINGSVAEHLSDASYFYARPPGNVDWTKDVEKKDHGIHFMRKYSDGSFAEPLALVAQGWDISHGFVSKPLPSRFVEYVNSRANRKYANDHSLAASIRVDVPLMQFIADMIEPQSVLEIGCGTGANLSVLQNHGVGELRGLREKDTKDTIFDRKYLSCGDYSKLTEIRRSFDVIMCMDAFTGLSDEQTRNITGCMARAAQKAVIYLDGDETGNRLAGKSGSLQQVCEYWASLGWGLDVAATLSARAIASLHSYRRDLLIFRPITEVGEIGKVELDFLQSIKKMVFHLDAQDHIVVANIFDLEIERYLSAYEPCALEDVG